MCSARVYWLSALLDVSFWPINLFDWKCVFLLPLVRSSILPDTVESGGVIHRSSVDFESGSFSTQDSAARHRKRIPVAEGAWHRWAARIAL